MSEVVAGSARFMVRATREASGWVARATRVENGEAFGSEHTAPTEAEAIARASRWLRWQASHGEALADLQRAERAYHRVVTERAFAGGQPDPQAAATHREWLDAIEAARIRLDAVRRARPE